jgi:hypothetical protein
LQLSAGMELHMHSCSSRLQHRVEDRQFVAFGQLCSPGTWNFVGGDGCRWPWQKQVIVFISLVVKLQRPGWQGVCCA